MTEKTPDYVYWQQLTLTSVLLEFECLERIFFGLSAPTTLGMQILYNLFAQNCGHDAEECNLLQCVTLEIKAPMQLKRDGKFYGIPLLWISSNS